eukprot:264026-Chlamydomonas_euryale.AAC.2
MEDVCGGGVSLVWMEGVGRVEEGEIYMRAALCAAWITCAGLWAGLRHWGMCGCVDALRMYGRMDGCVGGSIDRWCADGRTAGQAVDGWMAVWMNECGWVCMHGWMCG